MLRLPRGSREDERFSSYVSKTKENDISHIVYLAATLLSATPLSAALPGLSPSHGLLLQREGLFFSPLVHTSAFIDDYSSLDSFYHRK